MCDKGYMPQHTNTYTPQLQQEWFNTAEYAFPMQKKVINSHIVGSAQL